MYFTSISHFQRNEGTTKRSLLWNRFSARGSVFYSDANVPSKTSHNVNRAQTIQRLYISLYAQTKGCLQFERKCISNDFAINAARLPCAVFNSHCDCEHAKYTRRKRSHLSVRHSICLQAEQLDFGFGIWPVSIRGIGWHASKIAIALGNLALSFAIVPCALHIVYDEKDFIMRLKLSGLLIFCVVSMTKYCILMIRRPKILRCIEYVKND